MARSNILDDFLDPLGSLLTPAVARRLIAFRADARTQARLDRLAEKSRKGKLSEKDRAEYDTYLAAIDFITVLQAKARSILKNRVNR